MTEQALSLRTAELSGLLSILLTTKISAVCDRWHLDNRATPSLKNVAGNTGDSGLRQAVEHTTAAGAHLDAAAAEIGKAVALVETRMPADGQDSE